MCKYKLGDGNNVYKVEFLLLGMQLCKKPQFPQNFSTCNCDEHKRKLYQFSAHLNNITCIYKILIRKSSLGYSISLFAVQT